MGIFDDIKGYGGKGRDFFNGGGRQGAKGLLQSGNLGPNPFTLGDDSQSQVDQRNNGNAQGVALNAQGAAAGGFAGQGEAGFGALGAESAANRQRLMDQASGKVSLSGEQLRQALGQNQAQQFGQAASASPQNAAMAARTAMNNTARMGYGMSGQAATAGIMERQQASQALSDDIARQRAMELQAALGSRQNAIGAHQAAANAYQGVKPEGSFIDKYGQAIGGIAGAAMMSDRRLKTSIKDGDGKAGALLEALGAKSYKYKNAKHGEGEQLGIMAQDLERGGLKSAVIETSQGKAVHGAKAAGAALALTAALHKRVKKLEGRK